VDLGKRHKRVAVVLGSTGDEAVEAGQVAERAGHLQPQRVEAIKGEDRVVSVHAGVSDGGELGEPRRCGASRDARALYASRVGAVAVKRYGVPCTSIWPMNG
jgi:hypothetical protein